MGIEKSGINLWRLDAHIRKSGEGIRKRETFQGTKREAQDRLAQLKNELRSGLAVPQSNTPELFEEVLDLYDLRTPVPPKRRSQFNQLKRDLGSVPLVALSDRLEKYLRLLKVAPSARGKPYSNASMNRLMQLVMAALNLTVRLELLDKNPISRVRFPKYREVPRDRVLSESELFTLFDVMMTKAPHLLQVVRFALQVPCRKSELVGMLNSDLDLDRQAIRVRNGTTKNDQGIWKPVPPNMIDYFSRLPPDCPYLFYRVEKGIYKPLGDFKKAWGHCLREAGISDFRFHDSRHISASALLNNGTPEQVVMQIAGWKSNMLKTYYHRDGLSALSLVKFG